MVLFNLYIAHCTVCIWEFSEKPNLHTRKHCYIMASVYELNRDS